MTIGVSVDGQSVPIDESVFRMLLDNSVAGTYRRYERALDERSIKLTDLIFLARKGEIPYPLFFAPIQLVEAQVATKTQKLLAGISRTTFQIGTRSEVQLRDIELLVRDLIRKQELLKSLDSSLTRNRVVGLLRKPSESPESDATRLMSAIDLTHDALRACRTKEAALELMIRRLESNQILVARSVRGYMPQRLSGVRFSGVTVRDAKVPFVFLSGGDHGDYQEPVGRTIFTLALMSVLVARRIFSPVAWDGHATGTDLGREYDIAGAMLMPSNRVRELNPSSLDDMKSAADHFKVTPSAVTVRAMRLGQINGEVAGAYLEQLREEFGRLPQRKGSNPIRPENAVRKYAGRELTRRMLEAMDSGHITPREFCRTICLNKLQPNQLLDLRKAIR
jgi:hypothetical protein